MGQIQKSEAFENFKDSPLRLCVLGTFEETSFKSCIGMDGQEPNSILSCGNPMSANGMVTYSWGTPEEPLKQSGTVALLSCNLGFVPVGSTTSTCRDGIWMPALGICTAEGASTLSCPAMLPALGGTISYSSGSTLGPFESGTMAILRCNKGLPTGTSVSTCLNGQWSPPTLGTCSLDPGESVHLFRPYNVDVPGDGDSCAGILTPVGGILVYSSGGIIGPFPSGTRVSMQCNIGSPSGQSCNVLITPLGASLSYSTGNSVGPFAPGTTVTMTCIIGSPLVGFTCPELVVPPAGVMTMTNSGLAGRATQGTVATLRCPFGVQGKF
uniref:Sushi domain protein n=1 Tax=Angiostrongylus cantonensis TaxID=6313 RepID=A0A0K0DDU6_ANGCA